MTIDVSVQELNAPQLQFGGAGTATDPKSGLFSAGPFDMRFGSARRDSINVGIIGPTELVDQALSWLDNCRKGLPALKDGSLLRRPFPGFADVFRKNLVTSEELCVRLDAGSRNYYAEACSVENPFQRFQKTVDLYSTANETLADRDTNRPDVTLICVSQEVFDKSSTVERDLSAAERQAAKSISKSRQSGQFDMFDILDDVEQTEDDFVKRDLRHALKARALRAKLPIQIVTPKLLQTTAKSEDPATRAWNFSVGLYYKSGGIPWRLPPPGPETCFVGISFHHFRTRTKHVVQSSLAQAFSSEGEGFAIRGGSVPVEKGQRLNVHLSKEQAYDLGSRVLTEYARRTGRTPLRIVIHKTSQFDDVESSAFRDAFRDIPIVSLVTLVPSAFRLIRFGTYPPKVGTVCTVGQRVFLYTSGFLPELDTYPGSHVPQPVEIRVKGNDDLLSVASDALNLCRMNWNTADLRSKWPVTLSFARRVGGILNEYGESEPSESSFRYFV